MIVKGQKISDRYEIKKLIGEGGMANVYLGYDTILERDVAIKVLRGDLADDEKFVRRFRREAQSASLLNHPNIVQIYDVGEDDGNFYIVMEYIKGQTLKQIIKKRGHLSLAETIDIMSQLTDGLSHAHESYIIHRDIKPQNIMVLDDGMVKITDFGIAMAVNASDLTQTNSVMGSVHYLPPEQASGRGSTIKSDIYSLGIVMYEMLMGVMPFRGETAVEIAMKQLKDPIPSMRKERDDIPQSVENIILKATAKNPKNRYNNVKELYEDLKTCQDKDRLKEKKIEFKYPENEFDEDTKVVNNIKDDLKKDTKDENNSIEVKDVSDVDNDKKLSKFTKVLIALVSVMVVALFMVFIIIPSVVKSPDRQVPNVTGLSVSEARKAIEKEGLKVGTTIKNDYTEEIEKGKISKTSPKAGATVKKGATITLYKSLGSEKIEVADYTGKDYNKVKAELEVKGINVLIENKEVDDKSKYVGKENNIIGQSVEIGTKLVKGDNIILYIPNISTVYPDFVKDKWTINDIKKFCEEYGLSLNVEEVEDDSVEEETVVYQSRTAGSEIIKNASLTIRVSKKSEQETTDTNLVPYENEEEGN
jgi:serine/threonine-protein kinase